MIDIKSLPKVHANGCHRSSTEPDRSRCSSRPSSRNSSQVGLPHIPEHRRSLNSDTCKVRRSSAGSARCTKGTQGSCSKGPRAACDGAADSRECSTRSGSMATQPVTGRGWAWSTSVSLELQDFPSDFPACASNRWSELWECSSLEGSTRSRQGSLSSSSDMSVTSRGSVLDSLSFVSVEASSESKKSEDSDLERNADDSVKMKVPLVCSRSIIDVSPASCFKRLTKELLESARISLVSKGELDDEIAMLSAQIALNNLPDICIAKQVHIDPSICVAGLSIARRARHWRNLSKRMKSSPPDLLGAVGEREEATVGRLDEAKARQAHKKAMAPFHEKHLDSNVPKWTVAEMKKVASQTREGPLADNRRAPLTQWLSSNNVEVDKDETCTKDAHMIPTVPGGQPPRRSFRRAATTIIAQQRLEQSSTLLQNFMQS